MELIKEFEKVVNQLNVSNHIKILLKNSFKRTEKDIYYYEELGNHISTLYLFNIFDDIEYDKLMDILQKQIDILVLLDN